MANSKSIVEEETTIFGLNSSNLVRASRAYQLIHFERNIRNDIYVWKHTLSV